MTPSLLGINIGTSKIVAALARPGAAPAVAEVPLVRQDTGHWLEVLQEALARVGRPAGAVLVGICGTSGTFVLTDEKGNALGPPAMYNESHPETVDEVKDRLVGTRWAASPVIAADHSLLKLYHVLKSLGASDRSRVRWVVPQSVWLSYALAAVDQERWTDVTADFSNCRKLGGQIEYPQWSVELCALLSVPSEIFPRVVPSGRLLADIRSRMGSEAGLKGGTLFHGTADATAEAMALVADNVGQVAMAAGSTTSIKAVLARPIEVGPYAYLAAHPADSRKLFYTAWISVGENLRQRAQHEGMRVHELVDAAWELADDEDIPTVPLGRLPVTDEWLNLPAALFARGVMESAVWWEAFQLEALTCATSQPLEKVHMIGGTTRSAKWLQMRADAYRRPICVYSAAGALGALLPGLLLNGFMPSSDVFLDRYRVLLSRVEPGVLSSQAAVRRRKAVSWILTQ